MAEVTLLTDKVLESVNELQGRVNARDWKDYSRTSFIYNLTQTTSELEELASLIRMIKGEFERDGQNDAPNMQEYVTEINSAIVLLRRNQRMEEDNLERAKKSGIYELSEEVDKPEIYSSLEQKVLGVLLKVRYLIDRINVYSNKRMAKPITSSKAHRNILDLLENKENELQEIKKKFEDMRNKSFFGAIEENTSSDLEHEFNELARGIATENSLLEKEFQEQRKKMDAVIDSYSALEDRARKFEELNARQIAKTFELITSLKKERDYAKKIVLDIEHETLQLRSAYSKELLGIEGEKVKARETIAKKYSKRMAKMEKDLAEKSDLLQHFKKMVEGREKKIGDLEQKLLKEKAIKILKKEKKKPKKKGKKK